MLQQLHHLVRVALQRLLRMLQAPVAAHAGIAGTVQRPVGHGGEASLMRPGLEDVAPLQRLVQPVCGVIPQPRVQHQVGAACHHVDGIDLQQRHALHGGQQVLARGFFRRSGQQALGGQVQVAGAC